MITNDIDTLGLADDQLQYVYVERPLCPMCEKPKLRTLRSTDQGDGSRKKRTLCLSCGHRFFVIVETAE